MKAEGLAIQENVKSVNWVLVINGNSRMTYKLFQSKPCQERSRMTTIPIKYIKKPVFHSVDVIRAREKAGLSQTKFAELCGWSQSAQSKYELPGIVHAIDEDGEPLETMNSVLGSL